MVKHYPKWYYYRAGNSDLKFIMARMAHIPIELQKEVSEKYESLYLQNGHVDVREGRREANTYLHNYARRMQGNNISVPQGQAIKHEEKPKHNIGAKSGSMPSKYKNKILRDAGVE